MKLKRAKTLKIVNKNNESTKKLKIKSLSNKNVKYSLNSIINNSSTIKFQDNYNLKLINYIPENYDINNDIMTSSRTNLPRIRSSDEIISDIKSRLLLNKNLSFFITDKNGIKVNNKDMRVLNYRKKCYLKKGSHFGEFLNYNVFNEKDIEIKELINNFNKQIYKKKINKIQRRKNILNKLYGITPEYNNIIRTAKSQKNLSLEEYQDKILLALNSNRIYSSENLSELYQKFKKIKTDIETVTPYPKINIRNIINHFKNRIKINNDKKMRLKDFLTKSKEPQDEFERDEQKIISLKLKKNNNQFSRIQHNNLYMLPVHIRKLFIK
jgi:ribosome-binding protein aMBF1 (putative translation factor)